jgi:sarcosine oxidase subunit delta
VRPGPSSRDPTTSERLPVHPRQCPKGRSFERWRHLHGCGRFFNAARDTVSDKFVTTYKAGEPRRRWPPAEAEEQK